MNRLTMACTVLLSALLIAPNASWARSNGFVSTNCTGCHAQTVLPLQSLQPDGDAVAPGAVRLQQRVMSNNPIGNTGGFATSVSSGSLVGVNGVNAKVIGSSVVNKNNSTRSWVFEWIPDAGVASTTFTVCSLASNNNTASGDGASGDSPICDNIPASDIISSPTASAGTDQLVAVGATNVTLSGSTTGGVMPVGLLWSQIAGATVTLAGNTTAAPSFNMPSSAGSLTFRLTATDNLGQTATDTVTITVNDAPTASAGTDRTVNEGSAVSLDGSASSDPESGALTFSWSQTSGTSVALSGANTATPVFTAPTVSARETLVFTLTVTDNVNQASSDAVSITINDGPTAAAGPDQGVTEGTDVTLMGSGSADDVGIATYAWTQSSGTAVTLSNTAAGNPTFTAPLVAFAGETLVFGLTVTDAGGLESADQVMIQVSDKNMAPRAVAGDDITVRENTNVLLDGSDSYDPDAPLGSITTFAWEQVKGEPVTLENKGSATPSFTAPDILVEGGSFVLEFRLTVTDNGDLMDDDEIIVNISDTNKSPVADAGLDQSPDENTTVTLDGTGSTDTTGMITAYLWTQTSGTPVTLSSPTNPSPTFEAAAVDFGGATLKFQLKVTDDGEGGGLSATDDVVINVQNINQTPTAMASAAPAAVVEGTTINLSASASTDPDVGDPLSFAWTQTGGTTATLTGAKTATPSFVAPEIVAIGATDTLMFRVTVTDAGMLSSSAEVSVDVDDSAVGKPIANAGDDRAVNEGDSVNLEGSASSDPESGTLMFSWSQTGGPTADLIGPDTAKPSFVAPAVDSTGAKLTFFLTVMNSNGSSAPDDVEVTVNNVNKPPNADAGPDQQVDEGDNITLDGSASNDPDVGDTLSFSWTQTGGPTAMLSGADTAMPTFTTPSIPLAGATLVFNLIITDDDESMAEDSVEITVNNVNKPPNADAGPDQKVNEGATVMLMGANSTDDDAISSFTWTQTTGTLVTLSNAAAENPDFTAPMVAVAGETLVFGLTVTDTKGLSHADAVMIQVINVNMPPMADAGADRTVNENTSVTLDGSNSFDADAPPGQTIGFSWVQSSGEPVMLTDADTAQPSFTAPDVLEEGGTYVLEFTLTVTDGGDMMDDDSVTINVSQVNLPPVADAGPDQTVDENTMVMLNGANSADPDGGMLTFLWTHTDGMPVILDDPTRSQPSFTAPFVDANALLTFELTVNDGELEDTDTVLINISDLGDLAPVANAGDNQTANEGMLVLLDAGGSIDLDSSIIEFSWSQKGGPAVTLDDPTSQNPTFTAPVVALAGATLTFEVMVTDSQGLADTATTRVTVSNVAMAPDANAGADQSAVEGSTVQLDGSASMDGNFGMISQFMWSHTGGPAITLSDPTAVTPTFVAPPIAFENTGITVTLQLTITDDDGLMDSDEVSVSIDDNGIAAFADDVVSLMTSSNASIGVITVGGNLTALAPIDPISITEQTNRPDSFDFGLISMNIRVQNPGDQVKVTFLLSAPAPADASWVKFQPVQGWVDYSDNTIFSSDRMQVKITLTDGGAGDDDGIANRVIVDPGGLGGFNVPPPIVNASSGGSSGGGCAVGQANNRVDPGLAILVLLSVLCLWRRRCTKNLSRPGAY